MRRLILTIVISLGFLAWTDGSFAATGENTTEAGTVQTGQIPARDKPTATKEYTSKRYKVKEETDVVKHALDVFKKKAKSPSLYRKKIWLYDTLGEQNASFLTFTTNDQNADIVFSPDQKFVYYVEWTPGGARRLRGFGIGGQDDFIVNGADRFFVQTCENTHADYLVVFDNNQSEGYHVYGLNGQEVVLPDMPADVNDLKNVICY